MADATPTPPNPCQGWWLCFLNGWATPGGNIVLLTILLCLFVPTIIILMVKYGPGAPVVITLVTITGGFASSITTRMGITTDSRASQHTRASDGPEPKPGG